MSAITRARVAPLALLALLVVSLLLGAAGGAAAADVEVTNETVSIDSDTQSVYAEINNTDPGDANVSVEFVGIDADGNETGTLDSQNATVGAGNETLVEYSDLNTSAYSEVRVTVMLDNSTASESNVTASTGAIQKVAGGGGGFLDGTGQNTTVGLVVVVLVVVGFVWRSED